MPILTLLLATIVLLGWDVLAAGEPNRMINVWPKEAPGETTTNPGETLPRRQNERPPSTRIKNITQPQMAVFAPDRPNGTAVIVLPGGGYRYVVIDKEGSEVANWLNRVGVTVFILHYRTHPVPNPQNGIERPAWHRPLQDGQRALRVVRDNAREWNLKLDRIGVMGFSAGGQAAALLATRFAEDSYQPIDQVDRNSCRADFAMLIYPWQLLDQNDRLMPQLTIGPNTPVTFLVHAHDDRATSLSSIEYYKELKRQHVGGELHIFQSGGHGYGMRPVAGTNIHTWTDRATDWLIQRGLIQR